MKDSRIGEERSSADIFGEYLNRKSRRCTPERFMVLAAAEAHGGHFSADELHRAMLAEGSMVSRATVYNTVELLAEAGLLRSHRFDTGSGFVYESTMGKSHIHLVCTVCGKVKDVSDPGLQAQLRARRFSAFTPAYFTVAAYGVCSSCARKARKTHSGERHTVIKQNNHKPKISK